MTNIMNFYRGLIIVEPYGSYIKKRTKKIIVKSKYIGSLIEKDLLLIENKIGLGIIKLGTPKEINLSEFSKLRKYHQITEDDRIKWWPNYNYLYVYPITETSFFKIPILLNYVQGPQISVKPENIIIKKMFIGMSGYYYRNMYPSNVKNILKYYCNHLNSVEINSTFYHSPSASTIANLKKYNLIYTIKVNKYITHSKKLSDVKKSWHDFYNSLELLHDQIFCFLFQFSGKFYFNDENFNRLVKLSNFLNMKHRYAFEFRDEGWMNNQSVNDLFNDNQWIMVISNLVNIDNWAGNLSDGYNPKLNTYDITSDSVYFRMHGTVDKYIGSYNNSQLTKIFEFIKKKPIKYAFIYFNNTDNNSDAFNNAIKLRKKFSLWNNELCV
jgi:uncharacterized protein YecE (DUF72 family)